MNVVRYADDAVLGFEHRKDAEVFLEWKRIVHGYQIPETMERLPMAE